MPVPVTCFTRPNPTLITFTEEDIKHMDDLTVHKVSTIHIPEVPEGTTAISCLTAVPPYIPILAKAESR